MIWQQKSFYFLMCFGFILTIKASLFLTSTFYPESYLYDFPFSFLDGDAYKIANLFRGYVSLPILWWVVHFILPLIFCWLFTWVAFAFQASKALVPFGLFVLFLTYPLYALPSFCPFFLWGSFLFGTILLVRYYFASSRKYYLFYCCVCFVLFFVSILYFSFDSLTTIALTHEPSQEDLVFLDIPKDAQPFVVKFEFIVLFCLVFAGNYFVYKNSKVLFICILITMMIFGFSSINKQNISTIANMSYTKNHLSALNAMQEQNISTVFSWSQHIDILQHYTQTAYPKDSIDKYLVAKMLTSSPSVAIGYLHTFYSANTSMQKIFETYTAGQIRPHSQDELKASFFLDDSLLFALEEIFTYSSQDLKGNTTKPDLSVSTIYSIDDKNNFYSQASAKKQYKTLDYLLDLSNGMVFRQDKSYFVVYAVFVSGDEKMQQIRYENHQDADKVAIVYKEKYLILLPLVYLDTLIVQALLLDKVDSKFFEVFYKNKNTTILRTK